jgi:hypothetical protein
MFCTVGKAGIPSQELGKAGNLDFFKLRFWNSRELLGLY